MLASADAWIGLGGTALVAFGAWVVLMLMRIDRADARVEQILLHLEERLDRLELERGQLDKRLADVERLGPMPGRRR